MSKQLNTDERIKNTMGSILGVPASSIKQDSSTDTIEGWDSLKHMNLLLALEQEFQVTVSDEDAANIVSFKLIKIIILELLSQN